jgi:methyl-accepting chemotaxis protein
MLKQLPIKEKLGFLSGILFFALFAVWMVGHRGLLSLERDFSNSQVRLSAVHHAARAEIVHNALRVLVLQAIVAVQAKNLAEPDTTQTGLEVLSNSFRTHLDVLNALPLSPVIKETTAQVRARFKPYLVKTEEIVQLAASGQHTIALSALPSYQTLSVQLEESLAQLGDLIEANARDTAALSTQATATTKWTSFVVLLVAAVLAIFLSTLTTRTITRPMTAMAAAATRIALGDITQHIDHESDDEIGTLATAFRNLIAYLRRVAEAADVISKGDLTVQLTPQSEQDVLSHSFLRMTENLRTMNGKIHEGAQVLASSITQIMASVTQLATSMAETATAVTQTATTVEEVKHTAYVAGSRARDVSDAAQHTAQITQTGEQAVKEAIAGMHHVREQMESIAQSVVKFGEQSQAIGDIIATVNELAERSNLLAVNAAIEAAKAGEQGKGFTVVAQEVRNLATQSKQATAQVRTILDDIQKAAHVAVLVTEQGTRAVENGVKQSIDASESIRALSHSITDAARAMTQISASSQQQLVGMDQVGMAIDSIKRASAQNAEGMRQIEGAAHDLHQVGQTLKELVEQYKLTTGNGAGHTASS